MNLANISWKSEIDFKDFRASLLELKNSDEKIAWRKNIVNTKMDVLSIYSKEVKEISKQIISSENKLNYLIDTNFSYYEETLIYGNVLSSLEDFNLFEKRLNDLSIKTDNWSTCDNIKFDKMYKKDKKRLFNLSLLYLKDNLTYRRRIGIIILFVFIENDDYISELFNILNDLKEENEYYVNIAASWLLCEMFIKQKKLTVEYYFQNKTNKFIVNKSIQKCRDSYRVNEEEKQYLLQFRVK